jgi:hypothetical protein
MTVPRRSSGAPRQPWETTYAVRQRPLIDRLAPVVDVRRARLRAAGQRLEQVGHPHVAAVQLDKPRYGIAPAPAARRADYRSPSARECRIGCGRRSGASADGSPASWTKLEPEKPRGSAGGSTAGRSARLGGDKNARQPLKRDQRRIVPSGHLPSAQRHRWPSAARRWPPTRPAGGRLRGPPVAAYAARLATLAIVARLQPVAA